MSRGPPVYKELSEMPKTPPTASSAENLAFERNSERKKQYQKQKRQLEQDIKKRPYYNEAYFDETETEGSIGLEDDEAQLWSSDEGSIRGSLRRNGREYIFEPRGVEKSLTSEQKEFIWYHIGGSTTGSSSFSLNTLETSTEHTIEVSEPCCCLIWFLRLCPCLRQFLIQQEEKAEISVQASGGTPRHYGGVGFNRDGYYSAGSSN